MKEIKYPVYLRDRDQFMCMASTFDNLVMQIEAKDVNDNEYEAWDSSGSQLNLRMDRDTLEVDIIGGKTDIAKIRNAIARYAELASGKPFTAPVDARELHVLFAAAESHIEKNRATLLKRIKRLFGKS